MFWLRDIVVLSRNSTCFGLYKNLDHCYVMIVRSRDVDVWKFSATNCRWLWHIETGVLSAGNMTRCRLLLALYDGEEVVKAKLRLQQKSHGAMLGCENKTFGTCSTQQGQAACGPRAAVTALIVSFSTSLPIHSFCFTRPSTPRYPRYIRSSFNDSAYIRDMISVVVSSELERMWKWSLPNLAYYPRIYLKGLSKITKNLAWCCACSIKCNNLIIMILAL
jgi:hypothetical protein